MRKLEDRLTYNGQVREQWLTADDGDFIQQHTQDVDGILDLNHNLKELWDAKPKGDGLRLVGSIPVTLYWQILEAAGYNPAVHTFKDEQAIIERALNDPDFRKLRIVEGNIG